MFLRPSRFDKPGQYEIYYGGIFQISQQTITPLLKEADRVFSDARNLNASDLMAA